MRTPTQSRALSAFTLVELLSTIAIMAMLIATMIPWIGNYVATARATADKQTFTILNDALTRYKTEGGSIAALTVDTPASHVLSLLSTPVTWNGLAHQFLRVGFTCHAASLEGGYSGRQYRFTNYGAYRHEASPISTAVDASLAAASLSISDPAFAAWLAAAQQTAGTNLYITGSTSQSSIQIDVSSTYGGKVCVWWGDGTSETKVLSTNQYARTALAKTYSGGSHTFVIVGRITDLSSWYGDGRSDFFADIGSMTCLQYVGAVGNNTLSGDLSRLPNIIRISVHGSGNLRGDISHLTHLAELYSGNTTNTFTGDISGLTSMVRLEVNSGTLTGSVNNLTALNIFNVSPTSHITGRLPSSIPGLWMLYPDSVDSPLDFSTTNWDNYPMLDYVRINFLTTAQQDALLKSLWDNRDVAKNLWYSPYINLSGGPHAPSATGLSYKALLQAYRTPNNDPGSPLWNVITN